MKRTISLFAAVLCAVTMLSAQMATDHIKNAEKAIKEKDYEKSKEELTEAIHQVEKLYLESVANGLLPAKLEALPLTIAPKECSINGNIIKISGHYAKKTGNATGNDSASYVGNEQIKITLTNEPGAQCNFLNGYYRDSRGGEFGYMSNEEKTKIQGHRAMVRFEERSKSGTLRILVGGALLKIESRGIIETQDGLTGLAKEMDFEKITEKFGK